MPTVFFCHIFANPIVVCENRQYKEKGLRILYFGMLGTLSTLPLLALLEAQAELVGLVLPFDRMPPYLVENGRFPIQRAKISKTPLNLLSNHVTTLEIAAQHDLPVYAIQDFKAQETSQLLQTLAPDLICVSCFSHLLPPNILDVPKFGCLNVHPTLLPHFRGSAPIFWTFRKGLQETGVTVPWMDEGFDTGDIVAQRAFTLPNGITRAEADWNLAQLGGELLVEVLNKVAKNDISATPQPKGFQADPWPTDGDFELDLSWTAQHAFNFMRGTDGWKRPYFVNISNQKLSINRAVEVALDEKLDRPLVKVGDQLKLQFSDGVLICN